MLNLLGATPEGDKRDYERFMTEGAFMPDEVKVYPCALIEGSRLVGCYERGEWRPYTEEELLDVLADDIVVTPAFCRISRWIRDLVPTTLWWATRNPTCVSSLRTVWLLGVMVRRCARFAIARSVRRVPTWMSYLLMRKWRTRRQ